MIELRGVRHRYGKEVALRVDRLTIDTTTVLVGHNGAGKSTLLLLVAGLLVPTEGTVMIDGKAAGSSQARRAVSFVPDIPALFDDLTLADQMLYVARLHDGNRAEPAPAAVELVDLLGAEGLMSRLPGAMSKGQRQKASLLVATSRPCSVLLTDEPTTGLDAESRDALLLGFQHLSSQGVVIVSSTHDEDLIASAGAQIHLENGQIARDDEPAAADDDAPATPGQSSSASAGGGYTSRWRRPGA